MKKTHLFLAAAVLLGVVEVVYFYPLLPDWMVIHFDAAGRPDGWGPKDRFFLGFAIAPAVMVAFFGVIRLFLRRVPDSLINLPNKGYWLAPERRQQTMDRLSGHLALLIAMVLLLVDGQLYLSLEAALSDNPALSLGWLWGMIGGFLAASIVWMVTSMRTFRLPSGAP